MTRLWILLAVIVTALSHVGCSTNPATGEAQLNFISTEREIALGNQASPKFLREYGNEIPSPSIKRYVSNLGDRLAEVSERPDLPWEFHVLDSNVLNAFALPGGKVFISRGLLAKLDNEAQLAGVLGHEVGHVTAQHIGQQMSQGILLQGVAVAVGIAGQTTDADWLRVLGVGTNVGGTLYLLKFGRDQELQADELALRYMTKLNYNPVGHLQVLEILKDASAKGASPPEFLSTHPLPENRIKQIDKIIRKRYPRYNDPEAYRFNFESFKTNVLVKLQDLPPSTHGRSESALLPAPPRSPHVTCTARCRHGVPHS